MTYITTAIRRYDETTGEWAELHTATNATIVRVGQSITAGATYGSIAKDSVVAETTSISDIVKVLLEATKPTSSDADIDAAVATAQKFAETDGTLSYDGNELVYASDVSTEAAADMIVQRDADGKIAGTVANAESLGGNSVSYFATQTDMTQAQTDITDLKSGDAITALAASKITGVLSLDNIPASALERIYIVKSDEARLALTTNEVQNGDVVKVKTSSGEESMYFVKDDTQLGGSTPEAAFEPFAVGTAASVPWSGVTGTPTDLAGYGITDNIVLYATETVDESTVSVVSNAKVKFTDVIGLDATVTAAALADVVAKVHEHTNKDQLDKIGEDADGNLTYNGAEVAMVADVATLATIPVLDTAPEDPIAGQIYFQTVTATA